jgi:thiamine pyrophosphate-dependent acetolactate synthase large subunit-like protein
MDSSDRLVDALRALDVDTVFGLPGVHNLPIWRALEGSRIRLVGVRHEQTAVYASDGYARVSGRLGVALVTTGPGAANTVAATGEAMASGSPVLVVATDIPSHLRRAGVYRGVLHETRDQAALFEPITKRASTVESPAEVGPALLRAAELAGAAPSGPVYVGVPTDFLQERAPALVTPEMRRVPQRIVPDAQLSAAIELLEAAENPLIWAGGGAVRADAGPAIGEIAKRLAAPLITTYSGRGLIAPDHPCAVPGPIHDPLVGELWDDADLVLAIGTDFDGMMTQNWALPAPARLIAVNVDAADASKNYEPTLVLAGDARAVAEQLLDALEQSRDVEPLTRRLRQLGTTLTRSVASEDSAAACFLEIFAEALPPDAVVVADMCIPGYWLAGYWRVPMSRHLAYPMGWGTLGFGFPAAVGSALAGAGPTVCVTGDGGFLFACGELATVAQERLPLTIVLVDDGGYGMLRFDQQHEGDSPFGVDLTTPDFSQLAHSFGIPATTFDGFGRDFERALADAVVANGTQMLIVNERLNPPPTTSPRWYRRA